MSASNDKLATRILWALVVGLVLGLIARGIIATAPDTAASFRWFASEICDPLGQVFLRLLFFVVVPLVFSSLALGVAQLGSLDKLGPMAARTFGLFGLNMAVGVALGLLMMNILNPGGRIDPVVKQDIIKQYAGDAAKFQERAVEQKKQSFDLMVVVNMFMPKNLLKSVVEFDVLPLILFALLVGAAATQLSPAAQQSTVNFLQITADLMTRIVHYALLLAPIAVPAMIFSVVVRFGVDVLQALLVFVLGVLFVMLLHLFGSMSLMLKIFSKRSPLVFFRAIRTVIVTAFSTSSSNATLPTSIQVAKEQLGVSPASPGSSCRLVPP